MDNTEEITGASVTRRALRWSLRGQTALVTGGTRGIGRAVVEELAGLGAAVYTCSRKEAELAECLKRWEGSGFRVFGSVCDLSVKEQREELLRKAGEAFDGKINILINNVGTNIRKPTVDYTGEDFSFILATNFESAFHMCQLAHPLQKASGNGSIVFISSVAGVVGVKGGSIYGATKGAMNQLAKNLACEWAKDDIRVNSVTPWYIKTSLVEHLFQDKEFMKMIETRTPLARVGEAEEVSSLGKYHSRTVLIWLVERFTGKRVVFLEQVASGLLIVIGCQDTTHWSVIDLLPWCERRRELSNGRCMRFIHGDGLTDIIITALLRLGLPSESGGTWLSSSTLVTCGTFMSNGVAIMLKLPSSSKVKKILSYYSTFSAIQIYRTKASSFIMVHGWRMIHSGSS